jgi:hypothetical protein
MNSVFDSLGYCLRHNKSFHFVLNQCSSICDECWKEDCIRSLINESSIRAINTTTL